MAISMTEAAAQHVRRSLDGRGKGYGIRFVFGLAVLGCLMSVILKLLQAEFPAWGWLLGPLATVEVLGFVSAISIYIAVKMVQGAKAELAAKKIRVNCVLPGTTDTPMIRTHNVTEDSLSEEAREVPLKRLGHPRDIANAILYLLSDASEWMTGTELIIDGGATLR